MRLAGDVAPHGARDGDHDAHAEGLQFDAEGAGVGVYGALGGAVDGAEAVGGSGGEGGDVDDEALGCYEGPDEGLDHGHYGEDVGFEGVADVVHDDVRGGDGVS